jgi:hypothetical protein
LKLRIMGTEDECRAVAGLLPAIVDVLVRPARFER